MTTLTEKVPIMIGSVTKVVVEVEDQERAKAFWTRTLGFRADRPRSPVPLPPVQQPSGWGSLFADPDGNRFALLPRGQ
jgi:catechol 2,3-dioxygenase-like lactoylglutathione lyase family enzyme